ncbi:polyketide synthase [Penicillium malachiteum]|uniref:polyketide synthase n=1 Tax=Penicillium malachiteum TaxID=1324776 RepID=UPI002548DA17|nr:polyketide synthase [Penicillium malachiteum]KAJ5713087.1 polyketide synthase [Penicillium malachiteum]
MSSIRPVRQQWLPFTRPVTLSRRASVHTLSREAHGTGTRAGDPVEVNGIRQIIGGKDRDSILHIGDVKANVGHSGGASGVISLIKVLLMMKHGKITLQAQFEKLNPNISALEPDQMAISRSLKVWNDDLRLAIVNSYGASGKNAAAVIAPPPPQLSSSATESTSPLPIVSACPVFICAASEASLSAFCNKLRCQLENALVSSDHAPSIAFSLATRQSHQLQHVFSTTATSLDDLQVQLFNPERYTTTSQKPKPIVLLFSGQNGNTVPSARALYNSSLLFRVHMHQCDEAMKSLGFSGLVPAVLEGIQDDGDLVLRHAAMFSIQYSSGMSWIDSGVKPQAVCGHSFGEWAALTVSGRATIIEKLWGEDTVSMVAIEADLIEKGITPVEDLKPFYEKHPDVKLDIACYNGPNNYVVAGRTVDIKLLESYLNSKKASGEKIRIKVLNGMYAYHSVMADSIVDESANLSDSIPFQEPLFPFESCHEGPWTGPGSNIIARDTRGTVYFTQAISRIVDRLGDCVFLEAGVGGPITAMARTALPEAKAQDRHTFVGINAKDPVRSLADATVTLWKNGQLNIQYWSFHSSQRASYLPVSLPPYQFERHRHWLDHVDVLSGQGSKIVEQAPALYQELIQGHIVVGSPIAPAAMYLELAAHAVALLQDTKTDIIIPKICADALKIKAPMGLDTQRALQVILTKKTERTWSFKLSSTKGSDKPVSHASGAISLRMDNNLSTDQDEQDKWARLTSLLERETDTEALRGTMVYKVFSKMAKYSSGYRGLRHLVGKSFEGAGNIVIPPDGLNALSKTPNDDIADPLVVDTFLQVPGAFVHSLRGTNDEEDADLAYICIGMDSVRPLNELKVSGNYRVYTKIVREDNKEAVLDVFSFDKESEKMVWCAKGLKFSRVLRSSLAKVLAAASTELKEQPARSSKPEARPSAPNSVSMPILPPKKAMRGTESTDDALSGVKEVLSSSLDIPVEEVTKQATLEELGMDSLVSSEIFMNISNRQTPRGHHENYKYFEQLKEVLRQSLDVPVEDITKQARLEELGSDSLVSSEILANISTRFQIEISFEAFANVTDVAALCDLISSQLDGNSVDLNNKYNEDQSPHSGFESSDEAASEWQNTVFEILSQSLDIPVSNFEMDSNLEDLGADSLVAAEIISNLNETFSLDVSPNDFAVITNVISLCNLIADGLRLDSVQTPCPAHRPLPWAEGDSLGWDELLGEVNVIHADGNHFSLMLPPMVNGWGLELSKHLEA